MNIYGERVLNILQPLNIMNLKSGSSSYAEIYAFSIEIKKVHDYLSNICKEAFVSTAEGDGLTNLESIWGADNSSKTAQERRNAIYNRLLLKRNCICDEDIDDFFEYLGCTAYYTKDEEEFSVTVDITDSHDETGQDMLESQIPGLFPLGYKINFCYG